MQNNQKIKYGGLLFIHGSSLQMAVLREETHALPAGCRSAAAGTAVSPAGLRSALDDDDDDDVRS